MHQTTRSLHISSVDFTGRQKLFSACRTILPLTSGLLVAHSTSCTLARSYLRVAPTIRCFAQSWTAGASSQQRSSSVLNSRTSTSMKWPTLLASSRISLQERYVYFHFRPVGSREAPWRSCHMWTFIIPIVLPLRRPQYHMFRLHSQNRRRLADESFP